MARFIFIDGINGAGKDHYINNTLIPALTAAGEEFEVIKEPLFENIPAYIKEYIMGKTDEAPSVAEQIYEIAKARNHKFRQLDLSGDKIFIFNRSIVSTLAYQGLSTDIDEMFGNIFFLKSVIDKSIYYFVNTDPEIAITRTENLKVDKTLQNLKDRKVNFINAYVHLWKVLSFNKLGQNMKVLDSSVTDVVEFLYGKDDSNTLYVPLGINPLQQF